MMLKQSRISVGTVTALSLAMAGSAAWAQTNEKPPLPGFVGQRLGHTNFRDNSVASMPSRTRWGRDINPRGEITGEELVNLARPLDRATFEKMVSSNAGDKPGDEKPDYDRLYADYLVKLNHQAFVILWMNRILDHESMKAGLAAAPSAARVNYAMRSVLVENAFRRKHAPETENAETWIAGRGDAELYEWLKLAVGGKSVRLNIDWKYRRFGTERAHQSLRATEEGWPAVPLQFTRLPETVAEFETQIREKLLPTHLQMNRGRTWARLLRLHEQDTARRHLGPIPKGDSVADLRQLYEAMREKAFQVADLSAEIDSLSVEGPQATDFLKRLGALHAEREKALFDATVGKGGTGIPNEEEIAKARERIQAERLSAPAELVAAARAEFAEAESKGQLKIEFALRRITLAGGDGLPAGDGIEARMAREVFNPSFERLLLPKAEILVKAGAAHVVFLRELKAGESRSLPFEDKRVQENLRARAEARYAAFVERQAAYELFRYNPFRVETDTCSDPSWPCLVTDAAAAAEMMFAERLLAGQALKAGANSTLGSPGQLGKVAEINSDLFNRVFQAPNAKRER